MDTVILAAGRGARLDGVAAPFWKPLMVVNGEPLVVTVARQAMTINLGRVVVVVSPENAQPICSVLASHKLVSGADTGADVIVQPSPAGPGDAFLRASSMLDGHAMILCADNVIPDADVKRCKVEATRPHAGGPLVVGTRVIEDVREAARFTLISESGHIAEGVDPVQAAYTWPDDKYRAWVGPLVVRPEALQDVLVDAYREGEELKIGAHLGHYMEAYGRGQQPILVECDCYDIGVTE